MPTIELQGRLEWPSILTLPTESADGNYSISAENRTEYTHTNGISYPVFGTSTSDVVVNVVEGGPDVSDDLEFSTNSAVNIIGQPVGVYEYTAAGQWFFFFQDLYDSALEQGLVVAGSGDNSLFETDITIYDDAPTRITVLDSANGDNTGGGGNPDGSNPDGGVGSPNEDSDGDGVNDAFDSYPLQNNTQCFP